MPLTKIRLNNPQLVLYTETDEGVVFHKASQSLYQLPALSISLLLAIDEGFSKQKSIERVAKLSNLQESELLAHYQKILRLFNEESTESAYVDAQYPELSTIDKPFSVSSCSSLKTYQVAQTKYSIDIKSTNLFTTISTLLYPCEKTLSMVDFQIAVIACVNKNNFFDIVCNGLVIERELPFDHVLPHLIDRLQILSFQNSDYQYCFHGAALETENGSLLLPGKSGAGKSTLSAVLASDGMQLYSDEMIVLNEHFQIMTLNLPIAIKSGSWKILEKRYPELKGESVWLREDGRRLKYIWPTCFVQSNIANMLTSKNTLLINPCYQTTKIPQAKSQVRLSLIDTLVLITGGGYQVASELTENKIDQLFNFISEQPCYQLNYDSTEQVIYLLEDIWQKN